MTQTQKHYEARWTRHDVRTGGAIGNRYQIIGQSWISRDGTEWIDNRTGEPVDTEEFHAATITLIGGPRNGEVIG